MIKEGQLDEKKVFIKDIHRNIVMFHVFTITKLSSGLNSKKIFLKDKYPNKVVLLFGVINILMENYIRDNITLLLMYGSEVGFRHNRAMINP